MTPPEKKQVRCVACGRLVLVKNCVNDKCADAEACARAFMFLERTK
jgi:hypothetical protein